MLTGVLLASLVVFLAWIAFKPSHLAQTTTLQEPNPGLASPASGLSQGAQGTNRVAAGGRATAARLKTHCLLKYGRAEGQVGMIKEKDQPPIGPESFAVGKDGVILLADVVNQRVLVYSSNGTYLRSLSLPGIALGDVIADEQGRVYVYDQVRRSLHQYEADGTPQSTLNLNPADIDTRGYFHTANNAVYFADAAARDVLVATLEDGRLTAADTSLERTTEGIHGQSGRTYSVTVDKGQALRLQVREAAGQPGARSLEIALPGIVSATYAGEDQARRFYVQTERLAGTELVLEVRAFSPAGEPLGTTRMPENNYAIWTARLVDVGADGTIVQFLPQQEQAQLNLFAN